MKLPENTTNQVRGSSGGGTSESPGPASGRKLPMPSRGMEGTEGGKGGEPFSPSTSKFVDSDRQQVTSRAQGAGEGSGTTAD